MKRKTEKQISLAVILVTMFIATFVAGQSNGQVTITHSETCIPPTISTQPSNLPRVSKGSLQTFSVEAAGTGPLSYQWYKSGIPAVAVGTNNNSYTICNVSRTDAGYYYVVVKNGCGTVTSNVSMLTTELLPQSSTVSGPSLAIIPSVTPFAIDPVDGTIPGVLSGIVDTPDPLVSKGTRAYIYSFRNRAGCVYNWTYTYTIDDSGGSAAPTKKDSTTVDPASTVSEKSTCTMIIPTGFSPNGDGINDYFHITCIEKYPDAKLLIYSRSSTLLYEQEHYGNFDFWLSEDAAWWNGTDRDKNKLTSGSYIYILDLEPGRKDPVKTGYVFISR